MVILVVKFRSALSDEEVLAMAHERADQFRALPGLRQKYYVKDAETGEICGVYLWDSHEALAAYRDSELARSIPAAYQVVGAPRIEVLDVLFPLRSEAEAEAS